MTPERTARIARTIAENFLYRLKFHDDSSVIISSETKPGEPSGKIRVESDGMADGKRITIHKDKYDIDLYDPIVDAALEMLGVARKDLVPFEYKRCVVKRGAAKGKWWVRAKGDFGWVRIDRENKSVVASVIRGIAGMTISVFGVLNMLIYYPIYKSEFYYWLGVYTLGILAVYSEISHICKFVKNHYSENRATSPVNRMARVLLYQLKLDGFTSLELSFDGKVSGKFSDGENEQAMTPFPENMFPYVIDALFKRLRVNKKKFVPGEWHKTTIYENDLRETWHVKSNADFTHVQIKKN